MIQPITSLGELEYHVTRIAGAITQVDKSLREEGRQAVQCSL